MTMWIARQTGALIVAVVILFIVSISILFLSFDLALPGTTWFTISVLSDRFGHSKKPYSSLPISRTTIGRIAWSVAMILGAAPLAAVALLASAGILTHPESSMLLNHPEFEDPICALVLLLTGLAGPCALTAFVANPHPFRANGMKWLSNRRYYLGGAYALLAILAAARPYLEQPLHTILVVETILATALLGLAIPTAFWTFGHADLLGMAMTAPHGGAAQQLDILSTGLPTVFSRRISTWRLCRDQWKRIIAIALPPAAIAMIGGIPNANDVSGYVIVIAGCCCTFQWDRHTLISLRCLRSLPQTSRQLALRIMLPKVVIVCEGLLLLLIVVFPTGRSDLLLKYAPVVVAPYPSILVLTALCLHLGCSHFAWAMLAYPLTLLFFLLPSLYAVPALLLLTGLAAFLLHTVITRSSRAYRPRRMLEDVL